MTPEQINIAIAELLGFTNVSADGRFGHRDDLCGTGTGRCSLPDYHGDLNACMDICAAAAKDGWRVELRDGLDTTWECEFMRRPVPGSKDENIGVHMGETLEIHYGSQDTASAALCEAFLRVKGKWTE